MKDKVAIVTGGATGIGAEIAFQMLTLGAKVVIAQEKKNVVSWLPSTWRDDGGQVIGVGCNIREQQNCIDLVEKTKETFGGIDILVNNGGGHLCLRWKTSMPKGGMLSLKPILTGTWNMIFESCWQVIDAQKWRKDHEHYDVDTTWMAGNGTFGFCTKWC